MMRVLVTGGWGFIGRNLVESLTDNELYIIDVASPSPKEKIDIRDIHDLEKAFTDFRPEAVIHLAALASVPVCEERSASCFEVNVLGTRNVAYLSAKFNAKLIFVSSAAVYGDPCMLPTPVSCSPAPKNEYGFTKLIGEELVSRYNRSNSIIFRLFNAFGPKCNTSYVIPDILRKLKILMKRGDRKLMLEGTGREERDFIYIKDVVDAFKKALSLDDITDNRLKAPPVYNLGSGVKISIKSLAERILEIIGKRDNYMIEFKGERRKGDFDVNWADISGNNALPGWKPQYDLGRGLKEYIELEFSDLLYG